MPFDQLGLSDTVLSAVGDAGYREPTPIQKKAIPVVLMGRDVLGCAQTGTGKTASFTLPMLDILAQGRARARMPRSLILEPTRELAAQVAENFETYGKYNDLQMALLIGGVSFDDQAPLIDKGVDVLIATPGRLLDHFERGGLLLHGIEILVIDEADRMLDMGFIPDVERIVSLIRGKRQTLFFSATMPPVIRKLADRFLTDPTEITVSPPASPAETVEQALSIVHGDDKREALRALLRTQNVKNALVFCNRKRDVDIVAKSLKKHGFDAAPLHGDMVQSARMDTLERFKNDEIKIIVCSDVAARGLDIAGLSHVFLFDLPMNSDDYVHRIGRTGRAGMRGHAFSLASPAEARFVKGVEDLIGREIPRFEIEGLDTLRLDDEEGGRSRGRGRRRRSDEGKSGERKRSESKSGERQRTAKPAPAEGERDDERRTRGRGEGEAPAPAPSEGGRPEGGRRGRRGRKGGGEPPAPPVVGLGDHVPAFLLRPVPVKPVRTRKTRSKDEAGDADDLRDGEV